MSNETQNTDTNVAARIMADTAVKPEAPKVDPLKGLRYGTWAAPEGTNPGMLKAARLLVLDTIDEAGGSVATTMKYLSNTTELGDHYTSLGIASLEAEAKVIRFKAVSDGKGTPPWVYRLPTADERKMLVKREQYVALVRDALPGASVSVHGVTCDLMTMVSALGLIVEE